MAYEAPQELSEVSTTETTGVRTRVRPVAEPEALRPQATPVNRLGGVDNSGVTRAAALGQLKTALDSAATNSFSALVTRRQERIEREREEGEPLQLELQAKGIFSWNRAIDEAKDDPELQEKLRGASPWAKQAAQEALGGAFLDKTVAGFKDALSEAGLSFNSDQAVVRQFQAQYFNEASKQGGGDTAWARGFHERLGPAMARLAIEQRDQADIEESKQQDVAYDVAISSHMDNFEEGLTTEPLSEVLERVTGDREIFRTEPRSVAAQKSIKAVSTNFLTKILEDGGEFVTAQDLSAVTSEMRKFSGGNTTLDTQIKNFQTEAANLIAQKQSMVSRANDDADAAEIERLQRAVGIATASGDTTRAKKISLQMGTIPGGLAKAAAANTYIESATKASRLGEVPDVEMLARAGRLNGPQSVLDEFKRRGINPSQGQVEKVMGLEEKARKAKAGVFTDPAFTRAESLVKGAIKQVGGIADDFADLLKTGSLTPEEQTKNAYLSSVLNNFRSSVLSFSSSDDGQDLKVQNFPEWNRLVTEAADFAVEAVNQRFGQSEVDPTLSKSGAPIGATQADIDAIRATPVLRDKLIKDAGEILRPLPDKASSDPAQGSPREPTVEALKDASWVQQRLKTFNKYEAGRPNTEPLSFWTDPGTAAAAEGIIDLRSFGSQTIRDGLALVQPTTESTT